MFDDYQRAKAEVSEPNLIPVMNLMMTLIPLLLLGATFFHLAVIPTSTSQLTPGDTDVPKTPTQVSMSLVITEDALTLTAASTSLTPEELDALGTQIPVGPTKKYDLDRLEAFLSSIKTTYPASNTIIVFPHDGLDYQTLVDILDRTRERLVVKKGQKEREPLFPVTVFDRLVPPPPEPVEPTTLDAPTSPGEAPEQPPTPGAGDGDGARPGTEGGAP